MGRDDSPGGALLRDVLARAVTPTLRAAGFAKSDMNYHRRHGETVQVINIQVSHGSTATQKDFYVNVGIAFDAICRLAGLQVLDKPKEYDCDQRGMRDRVQALIDTDPGSFVRVSTDSSGTEEALARCLRSLTDELDRIDALPAWRAHRWFDRNRPAPVCAQTLYLLGDKAGAWREVQDLAAKFTGRLNADRAEWWLEELGLAGLGPV